MTKPPEPHADPTSTDRVSPYAWRLLVFLTALNVLNFVDRTLIASLAPLLIQDLGLNRAKIGLLAGFGFVFFYSFVGLFLGVAADRWKRIPLVAAGLTLWSAMTALSGAARSFVGLAIPRIFVGIGEATLTPSALSMLDDAFPRRRLALASGVYYAGIPLGTALSLIASSWVAPRWGWRACFYLLGGVGVVAAALLLAMREPSRRGAAGTATAPGATAAPGAPALSAMLREFLGALRERPEILLVLLGGSMLVYGSGAALLVVTWLVEERGYPFARAAFLAGIVAVFAGFLGNLAGGTFGDWCAKRRANGHLFALIPMTLFFTPATLAFYLLPGGSALFFVCWFLAAAGTSAYFGPLFATLQELSPAASRSTLVAFSLLVMNLFGVGPGPLVTGWLGDRHGLTHGLAWSLAISGSSVLVFALALRRRRNVTRPPTPEAAA